MSNLQLILLLGLFGLFQTLEGVAIHRQLRPQLTSEESSSGENEAFFLWLQTLFMKKYEGQGRKGQTWPICTFWYGPFDCRLSRRHRSFDYGFRI